MSEANEMSCAEFADVAAELALGVLTGRERARALAHLGHCDSCRETVRQLTVTGEELVGLLPALEPPAGFETRVMDRLGLGAPIPVPTSAPAPTPGPAPIPAPATPPHPARRPEAGRPASGRPAPGRPETRKPAARWLSAPRRALAAAAVAVTVILAGLGGWGLHDATSTPAASPLASAPLLTASHHTAGQVFFYDTGSRWLYMSVDLPGAGNRTVLCQVRRPGGQFTTIGSFQLADGYGYWGSPVRASGQLASARLVSSTGAVLATAAFTA